MGWERRARGGRYYTRSRKVGGRVVREYVGTTGPRAELAARLDAAERAERRERDEAWRAERARLEELDEQLARLCEAAEGLARAGLLLAGYRRHDRGGWRRTRGQAKARGGAGG